MVHEVDAALLKRDH